MPMTNPTTIDRRDVAHPTNPIGGHPQIEQEDLGKPLDADADRLPAGGQGAAVSGTPGSGNPNDAADERYEGLPRGVPPARSGQASAEQEPAEIRGRTSNSGGADRIDPNSRIPAPVKQDLGFRRTPEEGER
jgi:hypothetical protein